MFAERIAAAAAAAPHVGPLHMALTGALHFSLVKATFKWVQTRKLDVSPTITLLEIKHFDLTLVQVGWILDLRLSTHCKNTFTFTYFTCPD